MNVLHLIDNRGSLFALLSDFLRAYKDRTDALKGQPPIGETSVTQKLDAIIEMQKQFEIRFGLLETRAENIHGLLFDLVTSLTTDPEKIKQVAASVKAVREKLQTSVDNQTKGE